jgi:hypothetical protein
MMLDPQFVASVLNGQLTSNSTRFCRASEIIKSLKTAARYGMSPKPGTRKRTKREHPQVSFNTIPFRFVLKICCLCTEIALPTIFRGKLRCLLVTFFCHTCLSLLDEFLQVPFDLLYVLYTVYGFLDLHPSSVPLLRPRRYPTTILSATSFETARRRFALASVDLAKADAAPFRLLSDDVLLPSALNAHRDRKTFDPDFVAHLLSRANSSSDLFEIILDTGCIFSITPDCADFVTYTTGSFGSVQTVDGPTANIGFGLVRWTLISENGEHIDLVVPYYHVPSSTVRLLSPQDFYQSQGFDRSKDQFAGNSNYFWMNCNHTGTRFSCPIDPRSNLPIALAKIPCHGGCQPVTDIAAVPAPLSFLFRYCFSLCGR